jgi:cation/acetate symporter
LFKGQNVAFMVGLAFAVAASGNFPALVLSIFWRGFTTGGAVASIVTGTLSSLALIALSPTIMVDMMGAESATFPLKNPAIVTIPLGFAVGILVSLVAPDQTARAAYDAKERRMIMGVD